MQNIDVFSRDHQAIGVKFLKKNKSKVHGNYYIDKNWIFITIIYLPDDVQKWQLLRIYIEYSQKSKELIDKIFYKKNGYLHSNVTIRWNNFRTTLPVTFMFSCN